MNENSIYTEIYKIYAFIRTQVGVEGLTLLLRLLLGLLGTLLLGRATRR